MKYKINRNKKLPEDREINSRKDFNKVLSGYQQIYNYKKASRPLYKDKKFLGLIIIIAVVLLAIYLSE
ncbi:MAG: hypothetical protein ACK40G_17890 [Cytophagaceae bacterium]